MTRVTYHSLIPDDGHPLFSPVGSFRDQGEVVLPNSFLSSVEGAVGTASNLEVSTGKDNDKYLRYFNCHRFTPKGKPAFCLLATTAIVA